MYLHDTKKTQIPRISVLYRCIVCNFIQARPTCKNMRQISIKTRRPYFQRINSREDFSVIKNWKFPFLHAYTPKSTTAPVQSYIMHSERIPVLDVTCGVCYVTEHSRCRATTVATPHHLWIKTGLFFSYGRL